MYRLWKSKLSGFAQTLQCVTLLGFINISAFCSNAAHLKGMMLNQEAKSQLPGGANLRQSFVYAVLYQ